MSRPEKLRKAVASVVEQLENRTLLTTVVGPGQFNYLDAGGNVATVTVGPNTTAEFIFGRVSERNNQIFLGDRVPPPPPDAQDVEGSDLFHIYVAQSDANSYITVSQRQTDQPFNLIPFDGSAGTFRVNRADNGRQTTVTAPGGTGVLLLGAKTVDIDGQDDEEDIPILSRSFSGPFGVRPALGARIPAGLQIAPGNDFGSFLFGGTVLGNVSIGGSIDTFYAGNLWTGDARGVSRGTTPPRRTPNFVVGGDLHSLLVKGSIGTDDSSGGTNPDYLSGFDARVGGIVGHVSAGDTYMGGMDVIHGKVSDAFGATLNEIEGLSSNSAANYAAAGWEVGLLEGDAAVRNDTFDTPQYLPSWAGRKGRSTVTVSGQLMINNQFDDASDYYGVALLAGQSITAQLSPDFNGGGLISSMGLGIYDPDGRLIATDYPNTSRTTGTIGAPIRITADRPGVYRIAVAVLGDADFNGAGGEFGTTLIGNSPYLLTVTEAGDVALGGVASGNNLNDARVSGYGFFVENGDLGALQADGDIISANTQTVVVRKGNLRSMEGAQIGTQTNGNLGSDPFIEVPRGNVGLVRGLTGVVAFNFGNALPIGGDYQLVSAATTMSADLIANRGIGVIRAAQMNTINAFSTFTVDADQTGGDGIIDLIDVSGDFGTLQAGGPAITTGPGGDVRYIHVGGATFTDSLFGLGANPTITLAPGERGNFIDDSGARIEIEPFPIVGQVNNGTNVGQVAPTISVTPYPIRSGGVALIDVESTGSVRIGGGGGGGQAAHVEIGTVRTQGVNPAGGSLRNPVVVGTDGKLLFSLPTTGTAAANLDLLFDGSGTVDVFEIEASDTTSIRNRTPGEIVSIDANAQRAGGTIGSLEGYAIGVAKNHTGAAVNGTQTIANTYPFVQQHFGITSGNVLNVQATGPVGNLNVTGQIGNVTANEDGKIQRGMGEFEGVVAPIVATGDIGSVNLGQGLLPTGTGNVGFAGIYAGGRIGRVANGGRNSDIRGSIVSNTGIDEVELSNGAIIGARIMVVSAFNESRRIDNTIALPTVPGSITNPVYQIGSISLSGNGGILGSRIIAANVGPITVSRGFGVFNSDIQTSASGVMGGITAEGYGIRNLFVGGGSRVNTLSATAKPKNVSTAEYTGSVRQSEEQLIDPFFGQAPNAETDLHVALGTSGRRPKLAGITDTGVIENVTASGNGELTSVFASQIRSAITPSNTTVVGTTFNFGNQIGRIRTRGIIDGFTMITGRLKSFLAGSTVSNMLGTVSGPVDDFRVVGTFASSSALNAKGPTGTVTNFIIDGSMDGDLSATRKIAFLAVGRDVGPSSLITAPLIEKQQIKGNIFGTIREA